MLLGLKATSLGDVALAREHDSAHAAHIFTSGTAACREITVFIDALPGVTSLSLLFSSSIELLLMSLVGISASIDGGFALSL